MYNFFSRDNHFLLKKKILILNDANVIELKE